MKLRIGIVGGGASGALATLAFSDRLSDKVEITIFEPEHDLGAGLAYKTDSPAHLLNVPHGRMSARASPNDFTEWLKEHAPGAELETFVPRCYFRRYLASALATCKIEHVRLAVKNVARHGKNWEITCNEGTRRSFEYVLVACGYKSPPPVDTHRLLNFAKIAIVGSGLSAIDIWSEMRYLGYKGKVHFISHLGKFALPHKVSPTQLKLPPLAGRSPLQILKFLRTFEKEGGQAIADALRSQAPSIWAAWNPSARLQFRTHLERYWKRIRHRIPPKIYSDLMGELENGSISIAKGHVKDGTKLNGFSETVFATGASVIEKPWFNQPDLPRVGPSSRETYYEITAIPEIRMQVADLAEKLAARAF